MPDKMSGLIWVQTVCKGDKSPLAGTRILKIVQHFHPHPYIVSTSSDGSGETARMRSHEPLLLAYKRKNQNLTQQAPTPYSLK